MALENEFDPISLSISISLKWDLTVSPITIRLGDILNN